MPSRDLRGCFLAAVTVLHYKNQGWVAVQSTFPTLPSPETVVTISSTSSTLHMHLLSGHTTLPAGSSWSPGSAASSMAPGRETVATLPDGKLSVLALGTHCAFIRQSLCWVPPEVHLKPAPSPLSWIKHNLSSLKPLATPAAAELSPPGCSSAVQVFQMQHI